MTESRPLVGVIEDDLADQMLFVEAAEAAGLDLRLQFFDSAEAFQMHLQAAEGGDGERPAMVLLDLNMPGTSGLELLQWIRGRGPSRILPVIVLSTSWFEEDVRDCYAAGANAFLVKPLRFDELAETLKAFATFWVDAVRLPTSARA